ncbi:MAG: hypothetical protein CMK09_06230 [Ponticaulis sp.]|nr:hypothetical protein [Ponticaulis sp.]|tara:strand:+ start:13467 stop:14549 length:1083 start_codon:yes stop_codon:yes gene_type:complete
MTKSDALGPSVWVASDGRAGHSAQALAIARALGEMSRWVKIAHVNGKGHKSDVIELTPGGLQKFLPTNMWWSPLSALPADQKQLFQPPWPTLWIGAGGRVAPYSSLIRELSDGATFSMHIMNPHRPLAEYDLVVIPEHDGVTGDNVLQIVGAPAYFAPEIIEDTELAFADLAEERGFKVAVILGGDSKSHKMTEAACERLEAQLLRATQTQNARLRIVCSRRTPTHARVRFRALAEKTGSHFWESPADGPNPYLAYLLLSDAAIVTEDSTSMLSETAYFGLPIHIARLEGKSGKFSHFHKSLIDRGIARWLDDKLDHWTYQPLREIDRVADAIIAKLMERYPPPSFERPTEAREGDQDRR